MANSDAIRAYITTLRAERGFTQDALADAMEIARRTYISWETGATKDIKTPMLIRAMRVLGGVFEDLEDLDDNDIEAARDKARKSQLNYEDRARLDYIVETQDPEELQLLVSEIRVEMKRDPEVVSHLRAYLSGRRSK